MTFDAHVVGAGPAGTVFAREAARRGLRVLVSEEHSRIGVPVQCSGLISREGMESLGVDFRPSVLHELHGARIYSPGFSELRVGNGATMAYVADRAQLDSILAAEAESAGAKIEMGKRVRKADLSGNIIIGADGISSPVAHWFNFPRMNNFVICMQAEFDGISLEDSQRLLMFLSNEKFPGLFGWLIPTGNDTARVGCGMHLRKGSGRAGIVRAFDSFVATNPLIAAALSGAREQGRLSGIIPVEVRKETSKGNVLLMGDAAGQVKATTGGGIVFGTAAARIAAGSLTGGDASTNYELRWRKMLGRELSLHAKARHLLNLLDDRVIDYYFKAAKLIGTESFLTNYGSMDSIGAMLSSLPRAVIPWMK